MQHMAEVQDDVDQQSLQYLLGQAVWDHQLVQDQVTHDADRELIAVALHDSPGNRKTLAELLDFVGKHRRRRRPGRAEKRHAFRVGSKWHLKADRRGSLSRCHCPTASPSETLRRTKSRGGSVRLHVLRTHVAQFYPRHLYGLLRKQISFNRFR